MEVLVSQADMTVTTTRGHSVRFQAGVPRPVPPAVVASALQAGARPASEAKAEDKGPTPREVAAVMRSLIEEGDPDNMTQAGKVRIDAIEQRLGADITMACRR